MSAGRKLAATWWADAESALVSVGPNIYVLRVRCDSNASGTTWSFTITTAEGEARGSGSRFPTRRAAKAGSLKHLEEITQTTTQENA